MEGIAVKTNESVKSKHRDGFGGRANVMRQGLIIVETRHELLEGVQTCASLVSL